LAASWNPSRTGQHVRRWLRPFRRIPRFR
jgi:hypothetical protein